MKEMNLQLFADAVSGKKLVYLYRVLGGTDAATALAFTTETKDGTIRTPGATEVEITATSILQVGDTLIAALEAAMDSDTVIEIWEANLEAAGTKEGTYKGKYYQGYLTEFEMSSNAEDFVECSLTFSINGAGKEGDVTVSADQQAVASYVFTDTVAKQS